MKKALCLLRKLPHYRFDGFAEGLRRAGYQVVDTYSPRERCDVLITWNRHAQGGSVAKVYERDGIPVIVAENGYIGHDKHKHHLFSLALDHHNGVGRFPIGDYDRWKGFNIELMPWITERGYDYLLLPQRGIGPPGVAMPRNWVDQMKARLRSTKRQIRVRDHPGGKRNIKPLQDDLPGVFMACVWGSGAGVKAIVAGMPVYHELPGWIGAAAASRDFHKPFLGDRTEMLKTVAWAQWRIDEIATGEPFDRLLIHAGEKTCV